MGDTTESLTPPPPAPPVTSSAAAAAVASPASTPASARAMPVREDCWSEDATATLIEAWGRRYVELNRGNLRQKDWQDVADAVNALHGLTKKTHRTDVQCKNRIDTIKKKYKVEKTKVSASNGVVASSWTFFDRLDSLIGPNLLKKPSPPSLSPSPPVAVPLLPYRKAIVALPQKRSAPPPASGVADESFFRRNYSAMAAAAAAAEAADDDDDLENEDEPEEEEEEEEPEQDEEEDEERESEEECGGVDRDGEGMRRLARAIARFGEVYEKVEAEKLRQMVELEKQRMQFAKDLEVQRMRMFMDTQVQLERIKRGKRSASNGQPSLKF